MFSEVQLFVSLLLVGAVLSVVSVFVGILIGELMSAILGFVFRIVRRLK